MGAVIVRLGLGINHQRIGVGAVGDPHLAAVKQVAAAFVFSLEFHAQHIAARTGLAHGQRAHMLTADQFGQVFLALLFAAVALDLVDTQVAVRAVRQADRRTGAADFLHRDHVRQVTHVGAAVFLADGDAQHAKIAHFLPEVHRELVIGVDRCSAWSDLSLGKFTDGIAQGVNVFTELEVETGQIVHGSSLFFRFSF